MSGKKKSIGLTQTHHTFRDHNFYFCDVQYWFTCQRVLEIYFFRVAFVFNFHKFQSEFDHLRPNRIFQNDLRADHTFRYYNFIDNENLCKTRSIFIFWCDD